MERENVMIISTGHLPHEEYLSLIKNGDEGGYRAIDHEYGTILILFGEPDEDHQEFLKEEMPNLEKIITFARANKFAYINFDQDAGEIFGFPTFDW